MNQQWPSVLLTSPKVYIRKRTYELGYKRIYKETQRNADHRLNYSANRVHVPHSNKSALPLNYSQQILLLLCSKNDELHSTCIVSGEIT